MASIKEQLQRLFGISKHTKSDLNLNSDQFPGVNKSEENKLEVRIGLDFGTAFTKVVLGIGNDFYAIPFKKFSIVDKFLLPSVLYLDENQNCHLGDRHINKTLSNLKDRIILSEFEDLALDVEHLCSIIFYLSLVLQQTRYQFMHDHWDQYNEKYLVWNLNVGMPTENVSDSEKKDLYLELSRLAWLYSLNEGPLNFDLFKEPAVDKETLENILEGRIDVYPECDALLLSYEKSIEYREGHHILIDIGAGTTDVSYLNVFEDEDEMKHVVFDKSVENNGSAIFLEFLSKQANTDHMWNRQNNFPDDDSLKEILNLDDTSLDEYKKIFLKKYSQQLTTVYANASHNHVGWRDRRRLESNEIRLAYILTGGGSKIELYKDTTKVFADSRRFLCEKLHLPKPTNLSPESISEDTYQRLIVAYGLAWSVFDLADTIYNPPPNEPEEGGNDWRDQYIGQDQV